MKATAIILGAGMASRMNGTNKQLLTLCGIPVIIRSMLNFQNCPLVAEIIVAARSEDILHIKELAEKYNITKLKKVCEGGSSRAKSAENAFSYVGDTDVIAVHDGARPFADPELIGNVIKDAYEYEAAIAAVPVKDTVKTVKDGFITETPERSALFSAQTPQVFGAALYRRMLEHGGDFTDDSQLAEKLGIRVRITMGSYKNIKITTPEDIPLGEQIAAER